MDSNNIQQLVYKISRNYFNIDSFRELQQEIIFSILEKKNTLAILPTGTGKSICFQIPAIIFDGLTIVITPLISLMKDQVRVLKEIRNINQCDYICSTRNKEEIEYVYSNIKNLKILYITPEKAISKSFINFLKKNNLNINLIVIDEAHCISLWGNSFRPSYLKLYDFIKNFKNAVIACFTATATNEIINDIIHYLKLKNPNIFQKSPLRNNLFISIHFVEDKINYLINNLKKDEPTIIYTTSKFLCEYLSYTLNLHDFTVLPYHADLDPNIREENQNKFINNEINIMVATSAFGMGVDKKNIRKIIHFNIPFEIEEYSQEIGRAGRDGLPSEAILLVSRKDFNDLDEILKQMYPSWKTIKNWFYSKNLPNVYKKSLEKILNDIGYEEGNKIEKYQFDYTKKKNIAYKKIKIIKDFVLSSECKNNFLLKYFNNNNKVNDFCNLCDFCINIKNIKSNNIILNDKQIDILSFFEKLNRKIKIEELRKILIGYSSNYITYGGFSKLKGINMIDFYDLLNSLKNFNLIEYFDNCTTVRYNKFIFKHIKK